MNDDELEGSSGELTDVLSQQESRCPARDSSGTPIKYKARSLILDLPVRCNSAMYICPRRKGQYSGRS
jgi:hypothetical protein